MGVRVCVGACACACAARGTPCVHARTHVHTRRSPLRRGARTGPPPTHRSDKTETIPHTHKSCARRPLRHTQLNSPRHAECVQCNFAAQSPPIRILTLLVVAIASLAHPPLRQNRNNSTHTHKFCACRPLRHTQLNSPRHAECVQCDFAAKSPPIRFSTLLVVSAQHRGSGWRHGGAPTSAALVVTTIFFHYRVGCWCEATRRHALLPQHCRWPVRCCLGQFARR
jgi:Zn ribbon nucleic-acid-binding protein